MMIGLEERLAKQSALATHWKAEAFRWAQQAESESIADSQATLAWAQQASNESTKVEPGSPEKEPPPVPVAWLQAELRSTLAALEASREREATLVSQLADAKGTCTGRQSQGNSSPSGAGSGATSSPLGSKEGRTAVAALAKLERTLGVGPMSGPESEEISGTQLEGWGWLTKRLGRLTSAVDGKARQGIAYTRKSPEPEPEPECITHGSPRRLGFIASAEAVAPSSPKMDDEHLDVLAQRIDAAEEMMVHVERGRWLAMEAYALRMKLRQCDLRAISAASLSRRSQAPDQQQVQHVQFSGGVVSEHFDYDFEDLIQQANTQVESVLSRVHICEQDPANKRRPEASPGVSRPASAAVAELAEELLMALRDCAALRRGMNDLIWVLSAPVHAKEVAARLAWESRSDETTAALLSATVGAQEAWREDEGADAGCW